MFWKERVLNGVDQGPFLHTICPLCVELLARWLWYWRWRGWPERMLSGGLTRQQEHLPCCPKRWDQSHCLGEGPGIWCVGRRFLGLIPQCHGLPSIFTSGNLVKTKSLQDRLDCYTWGVSWELERMLRRVDSMCMFHQVLPPLWAGGSFSPPGQMVGAWGAGGRVTCLWGASVGKRGAVPGDLVDDGGRLKR